MTIQTWIAENTWINKMNASKGLDGWNNYSSGPIEQADWIVLLGRNRDSEILDNSNFECALEQLGGESKNVAVVRFGHWGCGWFELLMVNPKSKSKIKKAYDIHVALQAYPVLDDSDYCEREHEYQSEYADGAKNDLAEAISKWFGIKNNKALIELAYQLNIECQNYYGNDSCIDVYSSRQPDARDVERLVTCLEQLSPYMENTKVYKDLMAAIKTCKVA